MRIVEVVNYNYWRYQLVTDYDVVETDLVVVFGCLIQLFL